MNIVYRVAERRDAEGMIEFLKCVGGETDNLSFSEDTFKISPEKEARFIEKFRSAEKDIMLVAEADGKIIANASVSQNRIARYSHRAELSIAVIREFWGMGVGSALMGRLLSFARENGIAVLYLEVRADNERAIALYKKFGFSEIGTFEKFFKIDGKYYAACLMSLTLDSNIH